MLVLFETPAGFALFKVLDEGKLSKVEVTVNLLNLIVEKIKTNVVNLFFLTMLSVSLFSFFL